MDNLIKIDLLWGPKLCTIIIKINMKNLATLIN